MIMGKTNVICLQGVGEILHIAKSGRIIVKLNQKVKPGDTLVDAKVRISLRLLNLLVQ